MAKGTAAEPASIHQGLAHRQRHYKRSVGCRHLHPAIKCLFTTSHAAAEHATSDCQIPICAGQHAEREVLVHSSDDFTRGF